MPPLEKPVGGNTAGAFVNEADIAAVTLRALDDPQAENRRIRITQNTVTQKEIVDLWKRMSGEQVRVAPVAAEELDAMIDSFNDAKMNL